MTLWCKSASDQHINTGRLLSGSHFIIVRVVIYKTWMNNHESSHHASRRYQLHGFQRRITVQSPPLCYPSQWGFASQAHHCQHRQKKCYCWWFRTEHSNRLLFLPHPEQDKRRQREQAVLCSFKNEKSHRKKLLLSHRCKEEFKLVTETLTFLGSDSHSLSGSIKGVESYMEN